MTIPLWCLVGFVCWMFLLLFGIGLGHFLLVGAGGAEPRDFKSDVPHGGERHWRLHRAHLNCVETLPPFATVVLVATLAGLHSTTVDALAITLLAARVLQSLTHVTSGENRAVTIRLVFFLAQWACIMGFVVTLAGHAIG